MHYNSDIANFAWKTDEGEGGSIVLLIFVLWRCFTCRWVKSCGLGEKVLFRASWTLFFSSRDLSCRSISMIHSGLLHGLDISTFNFLWAIVVSDFSSLEICKHLVLPLSSITFTANSQADNHFCKYIYLFLLFQVLYSNGLQKNWKWSIWYISNGLQKKLFIEKKNFFCSLSSTTIFHFLSRKVFENYQFYYNFTKNVRGNILDLIYRFWICSFLSTFSVFLNDYFFK